MFTSGSQVASSSSKISKPRPDEFKQKSWGFRSRRMRPDAHAPARTHTHKERRRGMGTCFQTVILKTAACLPVAPKLHPKYPNPGRMSLSRKFGDSGAGGRVRMRMHMRAHTHKERRGGGGRGKFIQGRSHGERGGPRARPRYPGVEDLFRRATFLRETHPYPSWLRYCMSQVVSTSASEHQADVRGGGGRGGWCPRTVAQMKILYCNVLKISTGNCNKTPSDIFN